MEFHDKKAHKTNKHGDPIWISDTLDALWGMGNCYIGKLTLQSAAYCARYILKKVTGKRGKEHYGARLPEYVTMSLKPGIGKNFYEEFKQDIFPDDFVIVAGKKRKTPKYYSRILEKTNPVEFGLTQISRIAKARDRAADNTPTRLATREIVLADKLKNLTRT